MSRRVTLATLLVGCGPQVAVDDDTSTTGAEATTNASVGSTAATSLSTSAGTTDATTTPGTTSTATTTGVDTSGTTDDASSDGWSFVNEDIHCFTHCTNIECDLWAQDCPEGEKCMPWANDGGTAWNSSKCSPIDPMPGLPGDPCTVEGSNVSGIDSCALGSHCWNVDPETNTGECVAMCEGSEVNPVCDDGAATCFMAYSGYINLCLPSCVPFAPTCDAGLLCVQADGSIYPETFACVPEWLLYEPAGYGEPCAGVLSCAPGLACVPGENVAGCDGPCCTQMCDPNAPPSCPDAAAGQLCIEYGDAPGLGYCGVP